MSSGKGTAVAVLAALLSVTSAVRADMDVDVLVVGGTTKGVLAAKAAKAEGKSVYLATAHAFLGEDLASTLELGNEPGAKPVTPLEHRLWRSIGGLAPFDYWPARDTDGIRWIYRNDANNRLSEPGRPPTMDDGVLYLDDISYRCVLRRPARVAKAEVVVLEPKRWIGGNILRKADFERVDKERPGSRKVATAGARLKFLAGPRKGETIELERKGRLCGLPANATYSEGDAVLFSGDVDAELSEVEVMVSIDPSAHHQLVSRIWFRLENAEDALMPPSPLKVKRTYDSELMEAGVDFITCSPVRRVFRDADGEINAVEIANRSGRTTIRAKKVVDATLYGMLGKVPAVSGQEVFSRIVVSGGGVPSAAGMKVEEFPRRFTTAHTALDGRMYRCTFSLPMRDGRFPAFATAEWEARELTKTDRLVDAADLLVWHPSSDAIARAKLVASGEIPDWGDYDVVVVGGGTAGAPAAVAAARSGARTLVVEFCDILGGVGTDGMVLGYFDGNYAGFTGEFRKACSKSHGFGQYSRAEVWRKMCRDAGVTVWLGAMGVGARVEGCKVVGVEVATPLGCGFVRAKCVIDGTGNSDIAAAAGAETELISAREIAMQSAGQSPQRLGYGGINSDFGYVNDSDAKDLWLFSLRARAGAPDAWDIAKLPDSRERRRIVPDLRLSGEDVAANRRFADTLAQAHSRQDPHGYLTDDFGYLAERSAKLVRGGREDRHMFYVNLPLRSTLPKGLKGISVIGLGAGIERDVVSITRMQADLMNMGYGAGIAAAMAAANGGDFRAIDLAQLRARLVEKGILEKEALGWTRDDDCSSDEAVAAAVASLPDCFRGGHVVYRRENRARAIPLLRKAYAAAQDAKSRQVYALALGLMGDATGVDTLVAVVTGKERLVRVRDGRGVDDKNRPVDNLGVYRGVYSHGSPLEGFVLALGRTRDAKAVAPLVARLKLLKPGASLKQVRMITLALEALGSPVAAEPLAALLRADGMHGYAVKNVSDLPPTGGYGIGEEYNLCFRELALARALLACGDFEGAGRKTYEAYARDPRGILRAHAEAVLRAVPPCVGGVMPELREFEFRGLERPVHYFAERPVEDGCDCEIAAVIVHGWGDGASSKPRELDSFRRKAAELLGGGAPVPYVVGPLFPRRETMKRHGTPMDGRAIWNESWSKDLSQRGSQHDDWRGGGDAVGTKMSSYDVIDHVLDVLGDVRRYPRLRRIFMSGFSAGGQFVGRYVAVGRGKVREGVEIRYAAMAPSTELRFDENTAWHYGLRDRPRYSRGLEPAQIYANLSSRRVFRACGTADVKTGGALDVCPAAAAQGVNRYERFLGFQKYLDAYPEWKRMVVFHTYPGLAHEWFRAYEQEPLVRYALWMD